MSEVKSKKSFTDMFKDNKEIFIVVFEFAIIVGLFYYFNKKISKLSKHIEEISQKIELQDDVLEKQNLTITEITLHLNSRSKTMAQPQQQPQRPPQQVTKKVSPEQKPLLKKNTSSEQSKPKERVQERVQEPKVKFEHIPEIDIFQFLQKPQASFHQPKQEIEILEEVEEEEEEISEDDLMDKELENEMRDLD